MSPLPALGLGAGTAAAGIGSSIATGGIPLPIILAIVGSLFGDIFGKKEDPLSDALDLKSQMNTLGMKPPFQSPYMPMMDKTMVQALLNQMGRSANFGWPEGAQMDTSFIDNALAQSFPQPGAGGMRRIVRQG